jgi:lipoprotein-anchoring transpeptidase ErfK/SrfK
MLSRRKLFTVAAAATATVVLPGCATIQDAPATPEPEKPTVDVGYARMYGAMPEEDYPIPAVDLSKVKRRFYRQLVNDPTGERPGTIVVDTSRWEGDALRRGVGASGFYMVRGWCRSIQAALAAVDTS